MTVLYSTLIFSAYISVIESQYKANKDRLKNLQKARLVFQDHLGLEVRTILGKTQLVKGMQKPCIFDTHVCRLLFMLSVTDFCARGFGLAVPFRLIMTDMVMILSKIKQP